MEYKRSHRHKICYEVKILNIISTEYTCIMTHTSYHHASKSQTCYTKIDLSTLNTGMEMLKLNPTLSARMIQPLLKKCVTIKYQY